MSISPFLRQKWPLLFAGVIAISVVIVFRVNMNRGGISLTVKLQGLAGLLALLAFAAAVVERAVEILISPWRDAEASKVASRVRRSQGRPQGDAGGREEGV